MTTHTIPQFTGRIQGGQSETKYQSRIRNDLYATERHYKRRVHIDRYNDAKAERDAIKEVWE